MDVTWLKNENRSKKQDVSDPDQLMDDILHQMGMVQKLLHSSEIPSQSFTWDLKNSSFE